MNNHVDIGPTPCMEQCQPWGTPDFDPVAANAELRRFVEMLKAKFPNPPDGAYIGVYRERGGNGGYKEVAVFFEDSNRRAADYAFFVEEHAPEKWDDTEVLYWEPVPLSYPLNGQDSHEIQVALAIQNYERVCGVLPNTVTLHPNDIPDIYSGPTAILGARIVLSTEIQEGTFRLEVMNA